MNRRALNINIFTDLFDYLTEQAKKARTSKTQYIERLLEQDKKRRDE